MLVTLNVLSSTIVAAAAFVSVGSMNKPSRFRCLFRWSTDSAPVPPASDVVAPELLVAELPEEPLSVLDVDAVLPLAVAPELFVLEPGPPFEPELACPDLVDVAVPPPPSAPVAPVLLLPHAITTAATEKVTSAPGSLEPFMVTSRPSVPPDP
jgi:hypothetical protein